MSKPSCCCRSANEKNPNCGYCGPRRITISHDNHEKSHANADQYQRGYQGSDRSYGQAHNQAGYPSYGQAGYQRDGYSSTSPHQNVVSYPSSSQSVDYGRSKPSGCICKSANEINPYCTLCAQKIQPLHDAQHKNYVGSFKQGYDYNQRNMNIAMPNRSNDQALVDNDAWSLLKPILVFTTGCYLTMKMLNVADELG